MEKNITVILNLYKRPEYLREQIMALKCQTIPPKEIWVWVNHDQKSEYITNSMLTQIGVDVIVRASRNFKYHSRFALGLLAQTEFVAFFDDDTIPGSNWFSNCLDTMDTVGDGILGGAGCILNDRHYVNHERVGWPSNNEGIVEVDLVGHAWFLRTSSLRHMWSYEPLSYDNGEDIHLSFAAKMNGVKTFCPPHPINVPSLSSSIKAVQYGNDSNASSNGSLMSIPKFYRQRDLCLEKALKLGWQTVNNIRL